MPEHKKKKNKKPQIREITEIITSLNVTRKSIGLYPSDHPMAEQSFEGTSEAMNSYLAAEKKLTLGVGKDFFIVEDVKLGKNNNSVIELADAFHRKGIAGITFLEGVTKDEIAALSQLITDRDIPSGILLVEIAKQKGLSHVEISPLDASKLKFSEGADTGRAADADLTLEEYIRALIDGRLAEDQEVNVIFNIAPDDIAKVFSSCTKDKKPESFERIYHAYFRKKSLTLLNRESLNRFLRFLESLSDENRKQCIQRMVNSSLLQDSETEKMLREFEAGEVKKLISLLEKSATLPQRVKDLLSKLTQEKSAYLGKQEKAAEIQTLDDIEITEEISPLFDSTIMKKYVDDDYREKLGTIVYPQSRINTQLKKELAAVFSVDSVDSSYTGLLIDLMNTGKIRRQDSLELLTLLSELTFQFIDTGRFDEVLNIHNNIYSYMLEGEYKDVAVIMMEYFFHSDPFVTKLLEAFRVWGRVRRDETLRLAMVLREYICVPLLDELCNEESPAHRKFYITILSQLGRDVLHKSADRLHDERWYVLRNMIYLLRECDGKEFIEKIRPFLHHKNNKVQLEAMKTLLHFKASGATEHLISLLRVRDRWLKEQAIKLCGNFKVKSSLFPLLEILEKTDVFFFEYTRKIAAIQALGKIGDPQAFDTLKKVFMRKYLFYGSAHDEIQKEIIKSMEYYPYKEARTLLEFFSLTEDDSLRVLIQSVLQKQQ